MQCLIIQQPYASLITFGHKKWEFRSYDTKPKPMIGIAASPSNYLSTYSEELNRAKYSFPRGVVLGTAELVTSFLLTNKNLAKLISQPVNITLHGKTVQTLPEPLGEPIEDVKRASANPNWKSYVWQLDNIKPLKNQFLLNEPQDQLG